MKNHKAPSYNSHTRIYLLILLLEVLIITLFYHTEVGYFFQSTFPQEHVTYSIKSVKEYKIPEQVSYPTIPLPEKLISPVIIWPQGKILTDKEKNFLREANPFGIVIKNNNFQNKNDVIHLINEIQVLLARKDIVFIADIEIGSNFQNILKISNQKRAFKYGVKAKTDLTSTKKELYEHGVQLGKALRALGFTMILAPVVDIQQKGLNNSGFDKAQWNGLLNWRTLSDDPNVVSFLAEEFTRGIQDEGVFVTYKHFPGLGSSRTDSHHKTPVVQKTLKELQETEFIPFANMSEKNIHFVMIGHGIFEGLDKGIVSTFSKKTIGYLKGPLEFDGFVISDALNMGALNGSMTERCAKAFEAGIDIVLPFFGNISNEERMNCIKTLDTGRLEAFNEKFVHYKKIFFKN